MDVTDYRIIEILQKDGRISMKDLGKIVGLTSPAVSERVKRLEESGVIVLIVDGFKGEKQAKNNYDELSEREYVEVLINTGLSKKDAIKTVCKDRKLKKDVVYKQVLDL